MTWSNSWFWSGLTSWIQRFCRWANKGGVKKNVASSVERMKSIAFFFNTTTRGRGTTHRIPDFRSSKKNTVEFRGPLLNSFFPERYPCLFVPVSRMSLSSMALEFVSAASSSVSELASSGMARGLNNFIAEIRDCPDKASEVSECTL